MKEAKIKILEKCMKNFARVWNLFRKEHWNFFFKIMLHRRAYTTANFNDAIIH